MKGINKYLTVFGVFNLLSRILGFLRDVLISYRIGASVFSDIFFVGFRLPNLFRSIFADGAFSSVFLPIYSEIKVKDGKNAALQFAYKMQLLLIAVLIITIIIIEIFMGGLLKVMSPGLFNTENSSLLLLVSRIMFPYIILISLVSLYCTILQSEKKFGQIAFYPIILSVFLIIVLIINNDGSEKMIILLSVSVILSGILKTLYLAIVLKKNDILPKYIKFSIDLPIKKFAKRMLMAGISSEIYYINVLVDTFFASTIIYGVSYLYYAERIIHLPLSLIGIALSIIILPLISEAVSKKDFNSVINIQNKGLSLILIFGIPTSTALILIPEQIIDTLFVLGGKFDSHSAQQTAKALQAYAFGLVAYMLNKVFLTVFFAMGDTKTPAKFAFVSLIANVLLNFILVKKYGHVGIAIASAISAWLNFSLIINKLRKEKLYKFNSQINAVLVKVFFSNALMIFVIQLITSFVESRFDLTSAYTVKFLVLFLICILGMASYFGVLFAFRFFSKSSIILNDN